MTLGEELLEKLNVEPLWTIPLGRIELPITVGVVATWGVMVFLVTVSIIFTRNMKLIPGKKQAAIELVIEKLYNMFYDTLGEEGKRYIPYLMTVLMYLGVANMLGIIGVAPPTKEMNTTAGLALMSILLIQYASIHKWGFAGWLKRFAHPIPVMLPMNIMELAIKPVSLCMRLFGNVLGAYIIMELVICSIPAVIPIALSLYFDIFDGCLQAYVFCYLTTLFVKEAIED